MTAPWLQIVHQLPGRTRLRSPILRKDPATCTRMADALVAVRGIVEVQARPYTGSALVLHDRALTASAIATEAARVLGCERILAHDERAPVTDHVPALSAIAQQLARTISEIDRDVRRATAGTVDLGTLATLGFFTAGAAEIITSGELPMPPWFNLAWWGFRTFVTTEEEEIRTVTG